MSGRFKCATCDIVFPTAEALAAHKKNFCSDSDYGDIAKLRRKVERIGGKGKAGRGGDRGGGVTFEDVTSFVKSSAGGAPAASMFSGVGELTLQDLRKTIQTDKIENDKLMKMVEEQRAQELTDEVKRLKRKKQLDRSKAFQREQELAAALRELEKEKTVELEHRMLLAKTRNQLRDYKQSHLKAEELQKKKELASISKQRERLFAREQALQNEIEGVETQILERQKGLGKE